jgi:hypothetical protein
MHKIHGAAGAAIWPPPLAAAAGLAARLTLPALALLLVANPQAPTHIMLVSAVSC